MRYSLGIIQLLRQRYKFINICFSLHRYGRLLWNWSGPDALQCLHKEIVRRGLVPTFLQASRSWQGGAAVPILRYHSYMAPVSYHHLGSRSNTSYGNISKGKSPINLGQYPVQQNADLCTQMAACQWSKMSCARGCSVSSLRRTLRRRPGRYVEYM